MESYDSLLPDRLEHLNEYVFSAIHELLDMASNDLQCPHSTEAECDCDHMATVREYTHELRALFWTTVLMTMWELKKVP